MHLYVCQGQMILPEGWRTGEIMGQRWKMMNGLLRRKEWLLMWWQLYRVKASRFDSAALHINRNTSESRMASVTFPPGFVGHKTLNVITSVSSRWGRVFWILQLCWSPETPETVSTLHLFNLFPSLLLYISVCAPSHVLHLSVLGNEISMTLK